MHLFLAQGVLVMSVVMSGQLVYGALCGDTLTNNTGSISSPGYPSAYKANLTCVWKFKLKKDQKIYLSVESFNLDDGDMLIVYNGPNAPKTTIIGNFTGLQDPFVVIGTHKDTTIVFKSGPKGDVPQPATRGFHINYSTEGCLLKIKSGAGNIRAPYYVKQAGSLNCAYQITAPSAQTALRLALTFTTLKIGKGSLEIHDGDNVTDPVIFNNTYAMQDVLSSGASLMITMELSMAQDPAQFSATYMTSQAECTKYVEVKDTVSVQSPGYPRKYPFGSNIKCRWVLRGPPGKTLWAQFTDLEVADEFDQIVLKDGASRNGRVMGTFGKASDIDGFLLTSGPNLWIDFHSDGLEISKGFSLMVTVKSHGGGFVNKGMIHLNKPLPPTPTPSPTPSPTPTPTPAPNGTNMSLMRMESLFMEDSLFLQDASDKIYFQLTVPDGMQVYLEFLDALLYPTATIQCYNGFSIQDPLVADFRSDVPFFPVFTTDNKMLIVATNFMTAGNTTRNYFNATFKGIEKGLHQIGLGQAGAYNLQRADYPAQAVWQIPSKPGNDVIAVKINQYLLGPHSSVTVYRGSSDQSYKLLELTNQKKLAFIPLLYIPQSAGVRVTYTTINPSPNTSNVVPGESQLLLSSSFQIYPGCGGKVDATKGSISTPQYPNLYPLNAQCQWTLSHSKNNGTGMLYLAFPDFNLSAQHSTAMHSVKYTKYVVGNDTKVNVTQTDLGTYSGSLPPNDVITSGDELWVQFSSKSIEAGLAVAKGFHATFEVLTCGGNITKVGQSINTPGFPSAVKDNLSCMWVVSLPLRPASSNTSVNIMTYSYEVQHYAVNNDTTNLVTIRDGGSVQSRTVDVQLKNGKNAERLSRVNLLWIRYDFKKPQNSSATGFAFKLTFKPQECAKFHQCDNGICLHKEWRCDGRDDCGDGTDERGCVCAPAGTTGISVLALVLGVIGALCLGVALACLLPGLYRRFKYRNYTEFRDLMTPVPT